LKELEGRAALTANTSKFKRSVAKSKTSVLNNKSKHEDEDEVNEEMEQYVKREQELLKELKQAREEIFPVSKALKEAKEEMTRLRSQTSFKELLKEKEKVKVVEAELEQLRAAETDRVKQLEAELHRLRLAEQSQSYCPRCQEMKSSINANASLEDAEEWSLPIPYSEEYELSIRQALGREVRQTDIVKTKQDAEITVKELREMKETKGDEVKKSFPILVKKDISQADMPQRQLSTEMELSDMPQRMLIPPEDAVKEEAQQRQEWTAAIPYSDDYAIAIRQILGRDLRPTDILRTQMGMVTADQLPGLDLLKIFPIMVQKDPSVARRVNGYVGEEREDRSRLLPLLGPLLSTPSCFFNTLLEIDY
jgi:hypothetical protein